MGMNAAGASNVPPGALARLAQHLHSTGNVISIDQAIALAIDAWLENCQTRPRDDKVEDMRGYQWKTVFLPNKTQLRMTVDDQTYFAHVVGDHIMFRDRPVSPRGFTVAIAGDGRNAWRDILVRRPGELTWKRAVMLRHDAARHDAARVAGTPSAPLSPADSINAAAASMASALRTTLALAELARAKPERDVERRIARHRRADDFLADQCSFD